MMTIAHRIALPVLSAAIMGGAALGLAGTASAATGLDGSSVTYSYMATPTAQGNPASVVTGLDGSSVTYSFKAAPTVYAHAATNWVPWATGVEQGNNADNANNIYGDLVGTVAHP